MGVSNHLDSPLILLKMANYHSIKFKNGGSDVQSVTAHVFLKYAIIRTLSVVRSVRGKIEISQKLTQCTSSFTKVTQMQASRKERNTTVIKVVVVFVSFGQL